LLRNKKENTAKLHILRPDGLQNINDVSRNVMEKNKKFSFLRDFTGLMFELGVEGGEGGW